MELNELSGIIVDAAMKVHTILGPGLLEHPYQACLKHELIQRGLSVLSEVAMPISYDGITINIGYRLDLLVQDLVIVEIKSVHTFTSIHKAQLLTYLRLSGKPLGLLFNFGAQHLRKGIIRLVNSPLRSSATSENPLRLPVRWY